VSELDALALQHGTDKSSAAHGFAGCYEFHLEALRDLRGNVLEIGVKTGASLRMWRDYFRNAVIWAVDSNPACRDHTGERIEIMIGDQRDPDVLARCAPGETFILIVDDGSHQSDAQQTSLLSLWERVAPGGYYICEDIHTSYMPRYGGGWRAPGTTVEFLKQLVDDTEQTRHRRPVTLPDLESIHFYGAGRGISGTCVLRRRVVSTDPR
jgi:methyltransferase family protein